ncbi:MAG: toll/interleukin-1 receptor domain-containing protein [Proteobacteria bacterium]|nr:toll/interleukin-1 receptor domain-containing protein [Pseudomonadota bacterium]
MLFLSHTSADKPIVRKLAKDLENAGFPVWLDEWRIRVGECIATAIEEALTSCQFVLVVLSPNAIASGWVDREWKAKYWMEVEEDRVRVLPIVIEQCSVPLLLRTKRYVDFTDDYYKGLSVLLDSIKAYISEDSSKNFYAYAPIVSKQLLSSTLASARNEYWDKFYNHLSSLRDPDRLELQKVNTLHYLEKWGLTVQQLRNELARFGFPTVVNPYFTADLAIALENFQRTNCMRHIDGLFGELTYREMHKLHSDSKG